MFLTDQFSNTLRLYTRSSTYVCLINILSRVSVDRNIFLDWQRDILK